MAASMLVLAAWSGYGYWRTTRQTELAQRLGEQIRDVEWLYRAAEMSPLHAIEPQKRQVRQLMTRLEQIMREAGAIAYGPGHYALGRASLTLDETRRRCSTSSSPGSRATARRTRRWRSALRTATSSASKSTRRSGSKPTPPATDAFAARVDPSRSGAPVSGRGTVQRDRAVALCRGVDRVASRRCAARDRGRPERRPVTRLWLFEAKLCPTPGIKGGGLQRYDEEMSSTGVEKAGP